MYFSFDFTSAVEYLPVARALRSVGAGDLIARHPELSVTRVVVSEAGASRYSKLSRYEPFRPRLKVPMSPRVIIKPSTALAGEFARRAADVASQSVRERGRFSIALSGGSIAPALLPSLARSPIPWEATAVFWIDERAVPPDDPESNYGSAMKLLSGTPAAGARFHPMEMVGDLERSARGGEQGGADHPHAVRPDTLSTNGFVGAGSALHDRWNTGLSGHSFGLLPGSTSISGAI